MSEQAVSFTGHRPEKIAQPFIENTEEINQIKLQLHNAIVKAIDDGYTVFLTGMAMGADIWAGEMVLGLQRQFPEIRLIAVIPFPQQTKNWPQSWILRFRILLEAASEVVMVSPTYTRECFFKRNRYLVDHSSRVIAVYNGEKKGGTAYTVRYASEMKKEMDVISI